MSTLHFDSMPSSEGGANDVPMDTEGLDAEPGSAEIAALAPLAEQLDPPPPPRLVPGTILADSFEIEEAIGAGGMGIVYRARDLQLGRSVALKLHRPMARGTERLLREAASMAKLTHPNVATVHEVGTHEGMLFIAMELIDGVTARRWVTEAERTPMEIATLYNAAGQGLAGAHRAGLVHRDFKPENVLVGPDDVPRVVDFGLARPAAEVPSVTAASPSRQPTEPGSLTVTGALVGTPAYMAPEQFDGGEVDARADQFSFCVSLFEALYGERPFAGHSVVQLLSAMAQGAVRPPPPRSRVPTVLRRIVVRGLAARPDERWPSMEALLDQLGRCITPRTRRWVSVSLVVGALGLGGGLALGGFVETPSRCGDAHRHLTNIWDDGRRAAVADAILGTGSSYASSTWEHVERELDDYADRWARRHTEVCEASTADAGAARDRRLRLDCMFERSRALRATVDRFAQADAEVVGNAVELVAGLPGFTWCDDLRALRAVVPPPEEPKQRQEVEALRDRLADIEVAREAGKFVSALAEVEPLVRRAEALGYGPIVAEAKAQRGELRSKNGRYLHAEQDLREAYGVAVEHHHDALALRTARALTSLVGDRQARHSVGMVWGGIALARAKRSGDRVVLALSLHALGQVLRVRGDYAAAQSHNEQALRILEETLGSDHPRVASTLNNLGLVLQARGEDEQAQDYYERALKTREEALGADHPRLANHLNNLSSLFRLRGEYEQARRYGERAMQISEAALGTDHPDVAMSLISVGRVHEAQGEYEQAQRLYERALAIIVNALGADHPAVAISLNNLGNVLRAQGRYEPALRHLQRALRISENALGLDHLHVSDGLIRLGTVFHAQGEYESAERAFERAMRIRERERGIDHPSVAICVSGLARGLKARGKYAQAQLYFERALRMVEESKGASHPDMAAALGNLGSVLRAQGEHEEARRYLERALQVVEGARGAEHPSVATSLINLGNVLEARGEYGQAQLHHERALRILENALGAEHPAVATSLNNLGNALRLQGKHEEARRQLERSLRIFDKVLGAEHPNLAHPLTGLATVALAQGDFGAARTYAERAVTLRRQGKAAPELLAEARFVLARASWFHRSERPRARALAEQARDALANAEVSGNSDVDSTAVEQWLAKHRLP